MIITNFIFKRCDTPGASEHDFSDYTFDPTRVVGVVDRSFATEKKRTRAPPPHEGSSTLVKGIELFILTSFFVRFTSTIVKYITARGSIKINHTKCRV